MPVVFAPASPFSARGFADAAGGQITDRRDAVAAQRQAQQAQNYTQASIASAGNETRAAETASELDARRIQQDRQIDFQRQAQLREFMAQKEQQQRAQQFEMARMSIAISQQEQAENTRRVNGLNELEMQVKEGVITPEQAADARYELVTGINAFQRRMQFQQSQAMKQKEAVQAQEIATMQKNDAMGQKFMLETGQMGGTMAYFTDATTGRVHPMAYDSRTGKYYNPFLEHQGAGKGEDKPTVGGEWGHLGTKEGGFDEAKALKDAKAYIETERGPRPKEEDKSESQKAWDQSVRNRVEGVRREFRDAAQKAPVTAPQQAQQSPSQPQPVMQAPQQQAQSYEQITSQLSALNKQYPGMKGAPPEVVQQFMALVEARKSAQ